MKVRVTNEYIVNQLKHTRNLQEVMAKLENTNSFSEKLKAYLSQKKHLLQYHVSEKDNVLDFDMLG